jgi:hypothetical protein
MPDTGAPWNIPYVDDSDLVRDFPAADEAQALAIAAGLTQSVQVRSLTMTGDQSINSATPTLITNSELTFTPVSAASKISIFALISVGGAQGGAQGDFTLRQGTTILGEAISVFFDSANDRTVYVASIADATNTSSRGYRVYGSRNGSTAMVVRNVFLMAIEFRP